MTYTQESLKEFEGKKVVIKSGTKSRFNKQLITLVECERCKSIIIKM